MAKIDYADISEWDLPKYDENAKFAEDFIYPYFNIDINGKKKPNKVGRDRFSFTLFNGKLIASRTYQNSSRTQIIQACKSGNSDACTQLIFLNSWEIPEDYPW